DRRQFQQAIGAGPTDNNIARRQSQTPIVAQECHRLVVLGVGQGQTTNPETDHFYVALSRYMQNLSLAEQPRQGFDDCFIYDLRALTPPSNANKRLAGLEPKMFTARFLAGV